MVVIKGSKTEANLLAAFAGETAARTKYDFYASQAKKDGYVQIAKFFEETANNEKEHAKIWFKLLHEGVPNTVKNLEDGIKGEHYEWTEMYAQFAEEAKEEGFDHIAYLFSEVAKIEKEHEKRYQKLLDNIKDNLVFEKEEEVEWQCSNCGHTYKNNKVLGICPVCEHPIAYFQIKARNY